MSFLNYRSQRTWSLQPRHPFVAVLNGLVCLILLGLLFFETESLRGGYLLTLLLLYFCSALLHWGPHSDFRQKVDHVLIFAVIGLTPLPHYTYIQLDNREWLFAVLLAYTAFGMLVKCLLPIGSRLWSALLYVVAGFLSVVVMFDMHYYYNHETTTLFWIGVGLYALQLLVYTRKWCDVLPNQFGYREVQHVILLAAVIIHIAVA